MSNCSRTIINVVLVMLVACVAASCAPVGSPEPTDTSTLSTATESTPTVVSPSPTVPPPSPVVLESTPTTAPVREFVSKTIEAPSLAHNLLGDLASRQISIYLPPSYATSGREYPVVYYLPGYGDTGMGVQLPYTLDSLIANGSINEMILVVADGINTLGGSFYVNSPVTGNWEDFIVQDLVSYIDANYRTISNAASRGISGHSMGGFGALNLAMKHPDVFGVVYSLSPGLFDPQGLRQSLLFSSASMIDTFLSIQEKEAALPVEAGVVDMKSYNSSVNTKFMLAYGTAFAPDPTGKPPYIDYPYEREGDALTFDQTAWDKWQNGFGGISEKIQLFKDNFMSLNGIVIDYGTNDENLWIPQGCEYFASQLTAANIPNQLVSFPGGHIDSLPERIREFMLPYFSANLIFAN